MCRWMWCHGGHEEDAPYGAGAMSARYSQTIVAAAKAVISAVS